MNKATFSMGAVLPLAGAISSVLDDPGAPGGLPRRGTMTRKRGGMGLFNDPVTRAAIGIIGVGMMVSYLSTYALLWAITYGLLFLLATTGVFAVFGPTMANIVVFFAVRHLFRCLRGQFRAFMRGEL